MATKKVTKTVKLPEADLVTTTENESCDSCDSCCKPNSKKMKIGYVLAAVAVVGGLALATYKGYIVSAIVDGKPIFRWDVNKSLMNKYGKQTIEAMVAEALLANAAKKENVIITQKDIDVKEEEIIKSFGEGLKLEDVLKFQGMTKKDFDDQVKLQLIVTKILEKGVTVSDAEIAEFIDKNKSTLPATDEATLNKEAKDAVLNQKISEKIQAWFTELKAKSKITRFE